MYIKELIASRSHFDIHSGVCGRDPPELGPPRCSAIAGKPEVIRSSRLSIEISGLYIAVLAEEWEMKHLAPYYCENQSSTGLD